MIAYLCCLLETVEAKRKKGCNSSGICQNKQLSNSCLISSDVKNRGVNKEKRKKKINMKNEALFAHYHLMECGSLRDVNMVLMFQETEDFEAKWEAKWYRYYFYP